MDALVEAAQEEGSVLWYTTLTSDVATAVSTAFEDEYGISTEFFRAGSSDLLQRYSGEAQSGSPTGGVILVSQGQFVKDGIDEGWMVSLQEAGLPVMDDAYPERFRRDDLGTAAVTIVPWIMGYNTRNVSASDAPSDWDDLADPAWDGKLMILDPTTSDSYVTLWHQVAEKFGESALTTMVDNGVQFAPGGAAEQQLAAGEVDVLGGVPAFALAGLLDEGAPVEAVQPQTPLGSETNLGITAGAENPNAARLFANYILSPEGNEVINGGDTISVYDTDRLDGYEAPPEGIDETYKNEVFEPLGLD